MFINCFNIYDKMQKSNKTKDTQCMKQINFIFTKNGFHLDETKEENTSSWAILFKKYKYSALYELGFENNLKGLTPSAFYLYQLSLKFIELLSNRP